LANELPEIRRMLCYIASFEDLFNVTIGCQKIISTLGESPVQALMLQQQALCSVVAKSLRPKG
jgi:hypothetical protein